MSNTDLAVRDEKPQRETHPAYGMVGFSRCHGAQRVHGSEIMHHDTITLRISNGSVTRDYHREWYAAETPIVEVTLSAEQFAQLLTNMNCGDGVPCTITFEKGVGCVELPPQPPTQREKHAAELKQTCARVSKRLDALGQMIDNAKLTVKERDALKRELMMAAQDIRSNLPFIQESFTEAMDHVVTDAKSEVEAFYQGAVQRTGLTMAQLHAAEVAASNRLLRLEQEISSNFIDAEVVEAQIVDDNPPTLLLEGKD